MLTRPAGHEAKAEAGPERVRPRTRPKPKIFFEAKARHVRVCMSMKTKILAFRT